MSTSAAGEYLVCTHLELNGFTAHIAAAGSAYDVIADFTGTHPLPLVKIQVKTAAAPQPNKATYKYHFHTRCAAGSGLRGAMKAYPVGAIDLFALVALDIMRIMYVFPPLTTSTYVGKPGITYQRGLKYQYGVPGYDLSDVLSVMTALIEPAPEEP